MKTYLAIVVLAMCLALAGCPKEDTAATDVPDKATTEQTGVEGQGTADPK